MFDSFLIHTCIIEAKINVEDSAGQPIEGWATAVANVACRLDAADGGVRNVPEYIYNQMTHILFLRQPSITLATTAYRINIGGTIYEILLVSNILDGAGIHHIELILRILT